MDEAGFQRAVQRAKTLGSLENEPRRQAFWQGYQDGLRRAYHGAQFGTDGQHERMLAAADSVDVLTRARGQGYKAALDDETGNAEPPRYQLTTDHAMSSYGQPVLVDEERNAYGALDVLPDGEAAASYVERELRGDALADAFLAIAYRV